MLTNNRILLFIALQIIVFLELLTIITAIEPITTSLIVGGLAAGGYIKWEPLADFTYGSFFERCSCKWIPMNINALDSSLKQNLFGQHIAHSQVIKALRSHHKHINSSKKPLVMSFHGTPGTGKNFLADLISKYLYEKGSDSKFVHKYSGRLHFNDATKFENYKVN